MAPDGIYVNLFESSRIEWEQAGAAVRLEMATRFPFEPAVALRVSVPQPTRFRIRVRVPGWAAGPMALRVNGAAAATGRPGAYVALDRTWTAGDTIAFTLPLRFRLTRYSGQEKIGNAWALEYGPILMAVVGDVDAQGGAAIPLRAEDLPARLRPSGEAPLHFAIEGDARHTCLPYWQAATWPSLHLLSELPLNAIADVKKGTADGDLIEVTGNLKAGSRRFLNPSGGPAGRRPSVPAVRRTATSPAIPAPAPTNRRFAPPCPSEFRSIAPGL